MQKKNVLIQVCAAKNVSLIKLAQDWATKL